VLGPAAGVAGSNPVAVFRLGGRPLDTLQAIDRNGRVIYVGSFSKSLHASLRLGFLAAPPPLQSAFVPRATSPAGTASGPPKPRW
jgi:DNA-binding transcriptional MocR family regulator